MDKIAKADEKYMMLPPDPGFNPVKAKYLINKTIRDYENKKKLADKKFQNKIGENIDVLATWLTSLHGAQSKPLEKYITRQYMTKLAGEKIMEKFERLRKFHMEHPNVIIG